MKPQRGRLVVTGAANFTPAPDRVLVTTVCRDAYADDPERERPSSITMDGFQDGFGEYSTHLPEHFKFSTNQPSYGLRFLAANVPGPTYLQYPTAAELEAHLASGRYDIIAISAYTWSLPWAMAVARRAKEAYGFQEAWLGSYAVMTDEPSMTQAFDRLFWGYSESNFSEAMGGKALSVESLEHPDLTTEAWFAGRHSTIGHILFRRGCPNICSYCADPVFQRGGEAALTVRAIDAILDRYREKNIRSIYFSNQDTDLHSKPGTLIVDSMSRRQQRFGLLTSFRTLNRAGPDGIRRLYDKGLNFLLLGLESLSDKNLVKTQRRAAYAEMYEVLRLLQTMKVTVTATYMICFEDDTPESIREAKKRIIGDLGVSVCLFNIVMPLPSTPMYWEYKQRNLIFDWEWSRWTGNHMVWRHPTIAPAEAKELLAEMRSEVNSPVHNPVVRRLWDARIKAAS
jgi:hypothetical protein